MLSHLVCLVCLVCFLPTPNLVTTLICCTIFSIFNLRCYGILTISYNSCHVRRIIIIAIPRNKEQKVRSSQYIQRRYFNTHIFPAKFWILNLPDHANATPTLHDGDASLLFGQHLFSPKRKDLENLMLYYYVILPLCCSPSAVD